jgi:hypothetical protein
MSRQGGEFASVSRLVDPAGMPARSSSPSVLCVSPSLDRGCLLRPQSLAGEASFDLTVASIGWSLRSGGPSPHSAYAPRFCQTARALLPRTTGCDAGSPRILLDWQSHDAREFNQARIKREVSNSFFRTFSVVLSAVPGCARRGPRGSGAQPPDRASCRSRRQVISLSRARNDHDQDQNQRPGQKLGWRP